MAKKKASKKPVQRKRTPSTRGLTRGRFDATAKVFARDFADELRRSKLSQDAFILRKLARLYALVLTQAQANARKAV